MKIYRVCYVESYEQDSIYGYYSTKEKAETRLKELGITYLIIDEIELDKDTEV